MREVIMRFSCVHPDVELCIKRNKKIIFKKLSIDEVMMLINQCASQTIFSNKINLLSPNVIGMGAGYTVICYDDLGAEAIRKIIATPYSHASFNGIKGFSTTVSYFEYLEAHPFPYKLLRKLNKKLRDVEV